MNLCVVCGYRGQETHCPRDRLPLLQADGGPPCRDADHYVGRTLAGRYDIEQKVARGGMSCVYKARHNPLGLVVAVKIMDRNVRAAPNAAARFQREAQAYARLQHPNTVRVHDFGCTPEGDLFLVMEWLAGRSLHRLILEEAPLAPGRAAYIGRQICGALAEAHVKGMVHRDLKPANVLLSRSDWAPELVKVLDFGLVKMLDEPEHAPGLTSAGTVMGTPRYMAPEQARGGPVDRRTDLFALGVILLEMLGGQIPSEAGSPAASVLAKRHSTTLVVPDTVRGRPVPAALRALIGDLLDPEPRRRPASAEEVEWRLAALGGTTPRAVGSPARSAAPLNGAATLVQKAGRAPGTEDDEPRAVPAAGRPGRPPPRTNTRTGFRSPWNRVGSALALGMGALGIALAAADGPPPGILLRQATETRTTGPTPPQTGMSPATAMVPAAAAPHPRETPAHPVGTREARANSAGGARSRVTTVRTVACTAVQPMEVSAGSGAPDDVDVPAAPRPEGGAPQLPGGGSAAARVREVRPPEPISAARHAAPAATRGTAEHGGANPHAVAGPAGSRKRPGRPPGGQPSERHGEVFREFYPL